MAFAKIDSHQHFWRYDQDQYSWISDEMRVLRRDYLPTDFLHDSSSTWYTGSISVQARQTVEETDWLLKLSEENASIKGVVGWLELCSKDIQDQVDKYSPIGKLKGLRHVLQDEKDDAFMLRADFQNGIACLEGTGLIYELLIFPRHLKNAIKLLERFPKQNFVLDHCAKPPVSKGEISEWEEMIRKLASYPNISCKVSGLVTEADWKNWVPDDFFPYFDVVWSAFGQDRIMIGSDWPVCLLAASYPQVACLTEGYFERYGLEVLEKLCGLNATRIYQLRDAE